MADEESAQNLTDADLKDADDKYEPFPSFREWASRWLPDDRWERSIAILKRRRDAVSQEALDRVLHVTLRSAAVDTGAIEGLYQVDRGFTFTVAVEAATWLAAAERRGPDVRDLIEAQIQAYEMAVDVATRNTPLTETWIRQVHSIACNPQKSTHVLTSQGWQEQEFRKGEYKSQPNHPFSQDGTLKHSYAPVLETKPEMERLVDELRSQEFQRAHAVEQAAYSHYALVRIHPFSDGNGRVARVLASIFLIRDHSIPLLIYADQKPSYFRSLELADLGETNEFVSFIADRARETMQITAEELRTGSRPATGPLVDRLGQLAVSRRGLTHEELDEAAENLYRAMIGSLREGFGDLDLPEGTSYGVRRGNINRPPAIDGYRLPIKKRNAGVRVSMKSEAPANAAVGMAFLVLLALPDTHGEDLIVRSIDDDYTLTFSADSVYPEISTATAHRLRVWAEGVTRDLLPKLVEKAESRLRDQGYLPDQE